VGWLDRYKEVESPNGNLLRASTNRKSATYLLLIAICAVFASLVAVDAAVNNQHSLLGSFLMIPPAFAQQPVAYTIADETLRIGPDSPYYYYYFFANAPLTNVILQGNYQELSGNDVRVILYDSSTCNVQYGDPDFNLSTCTTLDAYLGHEIQPSGTLNTVLGPGEYFLTVAPASSEDVAVNVYFELVGYTTTANADETIQIGPESAYGGDIDIEDEEDVDEQEEYDQAGGPLPGPGGSAGAFDLDGFGPYSPLNPRYGQPFDLSNPQGLQ
jgi:hypothetical protein